jgi:hypothetical protein
MRMAIAIKTKMPTLSCPKDTFFFDDGMVFS